MPSPSRRRGRQVTAFQAIALLLSFFLVAGVGGVVAAGLVVPAVAGTKALADTAEEVFDDLPSDLAEQELSQRSTVYDRKGKVLATFYAENRIVVPLKEIADIMQKAVIAVEDKRFYEHGGVDAASVIGAAVKSAATDETRGASTLTQQYVKNVLIERAAREDDRAGIEAARVAKGTEGLARKLREMKTAIALEKKYTKDEILERYLNIAQFGVSVYGVEAAAQYYFGMSAKDLDYIRAATLAGVTQSPTAHDPERNPEESEKRRNTVLALMYQEGYITKAEFEKGKATPLVDTLDIKKTRLGCTSAGKSAFFCDYVTKIIANDPTFGDTKKERTELLYRGGLQIHTTLDSKLQSLADKEVRAGVGRKDDSGIASALVTVKPGTGEILAMAQNRVYNPGSSTKRWETSVNYNTDFAYGGSRGFQPGSTFKPFTLAAWLEQRNGLQQVIDGTRREYKPNSWTASCVDGPVTQSVYHPVNAEGNNSGPMTVTSATANSVNTAFIAMANQLDLCDIFEVTKRLGVKRATGEDIDVMPANVLGSQEVSPLTMAAAYAAFAAEGEYCKPIAITKVIDAEGEELPVPQADCRQAISKDVANAVTYALQRVITEGSAKRVGGLPGRPSAGKTGTTNMNWHTWFVGYTPQLSTAVWVGHSEGNIPMRNVNVNGSWHNYMWGSSIAAPTWKRFMTGALEGKKVVQFPGINQRMLYGPQATVPDVIGKSESEAKSILGKAGFTVGSRIDSEYSDSVPKGRISYQSYSAGARVSKGTVITLKVSKGPEPDPCAKWEERGKRGKPPKGCEPPDDDRDKDRDRDDRGPGKDRDRDRDRPPGRRD
jgi:membrane peptidoglycan carboxypeptidase